MRQIDADDFDRIVKEQHEMWVPMMDAEEKYRLIDVGLMLAAGIAKGMPTIDAAVIDRDTRQSITFAVANLCADALFSGKLDVGQKRKVMEHVGRLNTLAGLESAASKIANALLPEDESCNT